MFRHVTFWIQITHVLGRTVIGILGFILFYVGAFMYETEEGKLESSLMSFWCAVDDAAKSTTTRRAAFLREVARRASSVFDFTFGAKLLSRDFFVVSFYLSLISISLCATWLYDMTLAFPPGALLAVCLLVGLEVLGRRHLSVKWHRYSAMTVTTIPVIVTVCIAAWAIVGAINSTPWPFDPGPSLTGQVGADYLALALGSYMCDIVVIMLSRGTLRWCSHQTSFAKLLIVIGFNLLLIALLIGPVIADRISLFYIPETLWFVASGNLIDAVIGSCLIALIIMPFVDRLALPIFARLLHSTIRFNILKERKWLMGVGATLVVIAFPGLNFIKNLVLGH